MQLMWVEDVPHGYDLSKLHTKLENLCGRKNDGTLYNIVQARDGGSNCHDRAMNLTPKVLNIIFKNYDWSANFPVDIQTVNDLVKVVKERAGNTDYRGQKGVGCHVVILKFNMRNVFNKSDNCRFTGDHSVYLLDAGHDGKVPYFVVYDQDVTATAETESNWNNSLKTMIDGKPGQLPLTTKVHDPRLATFFQSMIAGTTQTKGHLIHFLYVEGVSPSVANNTNTPTANNTNALPKS